MQLKARYIIQLLMSIVLVNNVCLGQIQDAHLPDGINWSSWDHFENDTDGKAKYLSLFHSGSDSLATAILNQVEWNALRFVDLDGDSRPDLVLNGPEMESPVYDIWFYLLKNDSLIQVFHTSEIITSVERSYPFGPLHIESINPGCCGPHEYEMTRYDPVFQSGHVSFKVARVEIRRDDSEYVSQRFPPVGVIIKKDNVRLVLAPSSKTIIKKYSVGSIGYACASRVGSNGIIWWQVFMVEPDSRLRLGWIQKQMLMRNPGK